jgi:hypothetical protein
MTQAASFGDPADVIVAITPNDSTDLTGVRGVYIGGTGNLAVRMINAPSTTVTIENLPVGTILPIRITRVMAATTASALIGFR